MRPLALVLALLLAGCASSGLGADASPDRVEDTVTLVDYLTDEGFEIRTSGLTNSTIPIAVTTTFEVTGTATPATLEVFEFEDAAAAERGLTLLRAEIRPLVGTDVYTEGPLVVYVRPETYQTGRNARLRAALFAAFGAPRNS